MKTKSKLAQRQNFFGYLLILPAFVIIGVFSLYPILNGLFLSFCEWEGIGNAAFNGIENYITLFHDEVFGIALLNTLVFVLGTVPAVILLSLMFGSLLNQKIVGKKFFRSVYFLPSVTSGVAIAMIWKWIFNENTGLLNFLLYSFGLDSVSWLTSSQFSLISVMIMSDWKSLGTNIVIMLAALQGVPRELYEVVSMDTKSGFRKFFHITIPMISPTIFLIMVMSVINAFQAFDQVMALTGGGPGNSSMVVVLYIYNQAFKNFKMGYASTLAYVLFLIILAVTLIQWYGKKHWVYSEVE